VKLSRANLEVQSFSHELSLSLNLDDHNAKPPTAKPKVQRKKEHPTLFLAQNKSSNLTTKILSMLDLSFYKKNIDGLSTIVGVSIPVQPLTPFKNPSKTTAM
jgi:hypothetical protein